MTFKQLLYPFKCSICSKEFIYCIRSGRDFRCYKCKSEFKYLHEVEKELEEMSEEEYNEIMKEIEEYEKSTKHKAD